MKTFATMIGIAACLCSYAQSSVNLIPNPSFEDSIACTTTAGTYRPNSWFSPNMGTPDYYVLTSIGNYGCNDGFPSTWGGGDFASYRGPQTPRTGNGYAGFGPPREYLEVELLDTLEAGKRYEVSYYVSLAEISLSSLDLIQFSFEAFPITQYDTVNGSILYLSGYEISGGNTPGQFLTDTINWMLVKDTIIADGGERFFLLGGLDTANVQYLPVDSSVSIVHSAYYYIDDVDLHCIDCIASVPTIPPVADKGNLFPNPSNNGQLHLEGAYAPNSRIEVLGMNGQLLFTKQLQPGQQTQIIDASMLPSGMYFYNIIENDVRGKFGKLVIQR